MHSCWGPRLVEKLRHHETSLISEIALGETWRPQLISGLFRFVDTIGHLSRHTARSDKHTAPISTLH